VFIIVSGWAIYCWMVKFSYATFYGDTGSLYIVKAIFSPFVMFDCFIIIAKPPWAVPSG
jgi:hypothetical protein